MIKPNKLLNFINRCLLLIILILIFSYLFFYHLDFTTLTSWDEAWYASIAREIAKTGDFIHIKWNGNPFFDHPPMGFWLMAVSYKIFGINEFSARFPSAFLGLISIILIYKSAEELFNKKIIGFAAALVMGTSVWYLIRVRSGNLDSIFVFFYILTIYLSIKSSKNFQWFPLTTIALGGLIMSKTLVGLSAIIPLLFINIRQILKIKKNLLYLIGGMVTLTLMVVPWYYANIKEYPFFIEQHFVNVGMRKKSLSSFLTLNPSQPLFYLHMGVRKWYYLWILAIGLLIVTLKFIKKEYFFLLLWNFVVLYPFLTAKETHIWHMIPVHLPMSLIIASSLYSVGMSVISIIKKLNTKKYRMVKFITEPAFVHFLYLTVFVLIAAIQFKIFYPEVIPTSKYVPDDVDISKRITKYKGQKYLDDDFLPIAVFYSEGNIKSIIEMPDDKNTMLKFFQSKETDFVMITRNWAVDGLKINNVPYKILEKNNSFSIVTR